MIIVRSPLRVSFFGGGTDHPSWFREHGPGAVISTTINKYVYVQLRRLPAVFDFNYRVAWGMLEEVSTIDEIKHPVVRACLRHYPDPISSGYEVIYNADLPSKTGLGSSSAFTVSFLNAFFGNQQKLVSKQMLAREAITVEQQLLGENVGCQDQIAAAYGGFNRIDFSADDHHTVTPLRIRPERMAELEESMMLFFTGFTRSADNIEAKKIARFADRKAEMSAIYETVAEGERILTDPRRSIGDFGALLDHVWTQKRRLDESVSNPAIDDIYERATKAGAIGGKLLGAGGGGFLLMFAPKEAQPRVRAALADLTYVPFETEREGASVVHYSPELDANYTPAERRVRLSDGPRPQRSVDVTETPLPAPVDAPASIAPVPTPAAPVATAVAPAQAAASETVAAFAARADEALLAGAERALDNGVGALFLLDTEDRATGVVTLDTIREAVRRGAHGATLGDIAKPLCDCPAGPISPVLDAQQRLIDVELRPEAGFVPVAEPDLGSGELRSVLDTFLSTWISSIGDELRRFEADFASYCGMPEGVSVSNGTVALHLAMEALGVGPGDEVIVPDLAFAACANTVIHLGARPVLADVDPETWCLSPETVEPLITSRTKAIMPVHVWGRPAPMTELCDLARRKGLWVIENCAEAHGAAYDGKRVGSFGDVSCFSFFANKIMTTGEGGICLTEDPDLARRMRILRDHGMRPERRYWHEETGHNFRMTNLQAAIGLAQLARLDDFLSVRAGVLELYREMFAGCDAVRFLPPLGPRHAPVTWFCSVLLPPERRAAVVEACKAKRIDIRPFTNGLSMMPAYARYARNCPVSKEIAKAGVNLPTGRKVDARLARKIAETVMSAL